MAEKNAYIRELLRVLLLADALIHIVTSNRNIGRINRPIALNDPLLNRFLRLPQFFLSKKSYFRHVSSSS